MRTCRKGTDHSSTDLMARGSAAVLQAADARVLADQRPAMRKALAGARPPSSSARWAQNHRRPGNRASNSNLKPCDSTSRLHCSARDRLHAPHHRTSHRLRAEPARKRCGTPGSMPMPSLCQAPAPVTQAYSWQIPVQPLCGGACAGKARSSLLPQRCAPAQVGEGASPPASGDGGQGRRWPPRALIHIKGKRPRSARYDDRAQHLALAWSTTSGRNAA